MRLYIDGTSKSFSAGTTAPPVARSKLSISSIAANGCIVLQRAGVQPQRPVAENRAAQTGGAVRPIGCEDICGSAVGPDGPVAHEDAIRQCERAPMVDPSTQASAAPTAVWGEVVAGFRRQAIADRNPPHHNVTRDAEDSMWSRGVVGSDHKIARPRPPDSHVFADPQCAGRKNRAGHYHGDVAPIRC